MRNFTLLKYYSILFTKEQLFMDGLRVSVKRRRENENAELRQRVQPRREHRCSK